MPRLPLPEGGTWKRFKVKRTLPPGGNHFPTVQVHELEDGGYLRVYAEATIGLLDGLTVEARVDEWNYANAVRIV